MTFITEIQLMMHGFGDCRRPLVESAMIIESVVHQQMNSLLHQAMEVAEMRGSKGISPEDILFPIRNDHLILQRLINYMGAKDISQKSSALTRGAASTKELIDLVVEGECSRKKICINFLQSINQTGEYDAICSGVLHDPVKMERTIRYDLMAQNMSDARYKDYCDARRASFCPKLRINKFREWLQPEDSYDLKLSQHVLELLNFLAYETVAQLVDLALLVKRDESGLRFDEIGKQTPQLSSSDYSSSHTGKWGNDDQIAMGMDPITPAEVREAVRRFIANKSPLAPFSKISKPINNVLLTG